MDKKLLIIKTGTTLPKVKREHGDFEKWIMDGMDWPRVKTKICHVYKDQRLPIYHLIAGIVITGAQNMVTEKLEWSEYTAMWLEGAVKLGLPTLGICYGHQLLTHALGGKVGDNKNGPEVGTTIVQLKSPASEDALFKGLPAEIEVHVAHSQTVRYLPDGSTLLAANEHDKHQAFRYGDKAWGVQFHPEFNADISRQHVLDMKHNLLFTGQDYEERLRSCHFTDHGGIILKRFAEVVRNSG